MKIVRQAFGQNTHDGAPAAAALKQRGKNAANTPLNRYGKVLWGLGIEFRTRGIRYETESKRPSFAGKSSHRNASMNSNKFVRVPNANKFVKSVILRTDLPP
jgi:hypothetical protein